MLVDLEVFYLGHLKNLYTIQYNTIQYNTVCGSMVDIQSAAAEIRRGIKKEDR